MYSQLAYCISFWTGPLSAASTKYKMLLRDASPTLSGTITMFSTPYTSLDSGLILKFYHSRFANQTLFSYIFLVFFSLML